MREGLLPLTQTAMLVRGDLAFHDYEGVAVDLTSASGSSPIWATRTR